MTKQSKKEKEISKFLDSINICYKTEKAFKDCKNKHVLKFDFWLPNNHICIEFDGEQHFKPIKFGNKSKEEVEKDFESIKQNDKIKNEYCKENLINIIRIKYNENIEEKLNFLKKYSNTKSKIIIKSNNKIVEVFRFFKELDYYEQYEYFDEFISNLISHKDYFFTTNIDVEYWENDEIEFETFFYWVHLNNEEYCVNNSASMIDNSDLNIDKNDGWFMNS